MERLAGGRREKDPEGDTMRTLVFVTVQENKQTLFGKSNSAKRRADVPMNRGHSRAQTTQRSDSFTRSGILSPEGVLSGNRGPGGHSGLCHHLRFPYLNEDKPL